MGKFADALCEIRKNFYSSPFEKCFDQLRNN